MIKAIQYSLGHEVIDNKVLSKFEPENRINNISKKTGIKKRYRLHQDESVESLISEAVEKINHKLNDSGMSSLDAVVMVTQSAEYRLPGLLSIIQKRIGLREDIPLIEINQGCSGFIYGLFIAEKIFLDEAVNRVGLITVDAYSKYIPLDSVYLSSLFSDACAITVLDRNEPSLHILNKFIFGNDGGKYNYLIVRDECNCQEDNRSIPSKKLFMDGSEILKFTLKVVPKLVDDVLEKNGLNIDQIDYFIFHQANELVIDSIKEKIGINEHKIIRNYQEVANTTSSSIPIALSAFLNSTKLNSRKKILLAGFGVGLSWGACILEVL